MTLLVQKFGGTSVGSLERIQAVAAQIKVTYQTGTALVIVVSAMSGETDRLLRLAYQITSTPNPRELASLITLGEQTSMNLLALCLQKLNIPAITLTGAQAGISTEHCYLSARIEAIDCTRIHAHLQQRKVVVIAGFQGLSIEGDITTLGRGGSDTSAVALAAALNARECQIYTDVDGIYTADPRLVPKALRLSQIHLPLMLELASLGAKVLQLRSVELAGKYHVPLRVLSSFHEGVGTLIDYESTDKLESPVIAGLAHKTGLIQCHLTLANPHSLAALLHDFAAHAIVIEHVNHQSKGPLILYITEGMRETLTERCLAACLQGQLTTWHSDDGYARLALVGQGVRSQLTIMQGFFAVLQHEGIHWHDFFSSELALSIILPEESLAQAAQALHRTFFEQQAAHIH